MKRQSEITHLIVHHSASNHDLKASDIDRMHRAKGWEAIGYHYVIEANPVRLVYGRRPHQVGAHCPPNTGKLGLCIVGDNTKVEFHWQEEQVRAAQNLIESIRLVFPGIQVDPHKKHRTTLCPGREITGLIL